MKKSFAFILFFTSLLGFAQIKPGVYKSVSRNQDGVLKINEDKTYEVSFFYGNYSIAQDTIHFNSDKINSSSFSVKKNSDAPKSTNLKLKFRDSQSAYYSTSIFVGIQETESSELVYKKLSDYVQMNPTTYEYPKDFTVELEKGKYLYLIDLKNEAATISKFQIPEDTNEVLVDYEYYSFSNMKLKGFIDKETGQLAISEGKTPLLFSFNKQDESVLTSDQLNPIEVKEEKNWLALHGFIDEAEASYANNPYYVFKHSIEKNYKEALNATAKKPEKLLIVAFDLKNKNAQKDFDAFLKTNEESLSIYMYDDYVPEYDKFNYYLATEKDKSILDKFKIKSDKELLFINAQGDLVYHTPASLEEKKMAYNYVFAETTNDLKKANLCVQLDKVLSRKNASAIDLMTVFKQSLELENAYSATDVSIEPVQVSEILETVTTAVDDSVKTEEEVGIDTATDSSYSSSYIKDKENLYSLKATYDQVQEKWLETINYFSTKNIYDNDFVTVAKAELGREGFSRKLFDNHDKLLKTSDFKLLDYIIKNYKNIIAQERITIENTGYLDDQESIEWVLSVVFDENTNLYSNPEKKQIDKVMDYYEQYLKVSDNNFKVLQNYLSDLKENTVQEGVNEKYVDCFSSYFDSIIKKDSNVIENLDEVFTKESTGYGFDWNGFKDSFSNLANDVAWHVVEKSTDKTTIQKAIFWSETSLKVSKNVHYYLDTLAQLYYKNGEKTKAISTEEKALESGKDSEYAEEYKITLEKMKKGSY